MLPGVTLVAEHDVGAHAALPCLVQDWAVHGKRILVGCSRFSETTAAIVFERFAGVNTVSFTAVLALLFVFCNNY